MLVHAVRVKARLGGDAKDLIPILRRVPHQRLEHVYGDKAYISRRKVQFIDELGAYLAIEPKKNLGVNARGHRAYGRLMREYRDGPEAWKKQHTYGKRSLVETVFGMLKVRFTGSLSSRKGKEQKREVLIKVILHNIGRLNFLECDGR